MYNIVPHGFRKSRNEVGSLLDRVFEEFFNWPAQNILAPAERDVAWRPPIDFFEDDSCYKVLMEIPGVGKDNVEINLENNILTVTGDKKRDPSGDSRRVERIYGTFSRSFSVPESVDKEKIAAKFENGVLSITVPKLPAVAPQKILIE